MLRRVQRIPQARLTALWSVVAAMAWCAAMGAIGTQQPIRWRTQWNQSLFAEAAREHRFVLLDLHAVWCHWCHVG
jgi:thiol:disulfide interchange protein